MGKRVMTFDDWYYYRFDGRSVIIIRVLHGHRDVIALAGQGGFEG